MAGLRGFRSSLAILEMQFEPLGVASGAASLIPGYLGVLCSGWDGDPLPVSAPTAQQFYDQLWRSAIADLQDHAVRLGADGVVGVSVSQGSAGPGWQLQLTGTAFRLPTVEQLPAPFLSLLPMSAFLTLLAAGWMPAGIAWGVGAIHAHGPTVAWSQQQGRVSAAIWSQSRANFEMTGMTAAVNAARHAAEQAVISSLADTVSRGVVGLSINIDRYTQGCYYPAFSRTGGPKLPGALVIATAVGTGIVPIGASVLSVRPTRKLSGGTHS